MGETRLLVGRCRIEYRSASHDQDYLGDVIVVCKPDRTVLVHDATGYQPVAWLTRAAHLSIDDAGVTATDGDQSLRVRAIDADRVRDADTAEAGTALGECPDCAGPLVHRGAEVGCLDCEEVYPLPSGGTVHEETCPDCGLPTVTVERGVRVTVCVDRACDPLEARLAADLDDRWDCPECTGSLEVVRAGGLLLGCERYPDCETGFALPAGRQAGTCDCGLPAFDTSTGRRCLDRACPSA